MKKLLLSIVLANLLVACASDKPKETSSAADTSSSAPTTASTSVGDGTNGKTVGNAASATTAADAAKVDAANKAADMMNHRSVYFPFDVDSVQASDRATIQTHGAYLGKNKTAKVRVEGNADERGSTEYNLALGQRRANNVKKALIVAGAKASQVEAVSIGEEKPQATGHDEAAWSQNRRADIIYIPNPK